MSLNLPRHGYSWMANHGVLFPRDMRPMDSYAISSIMARLECHENHLIDPVTGDLIKRPRTHLFPQTYSDITLTKK